MPSASVKTDRSQVRGEPHHAVRTGGHAREIVPRQTVFALMELPAAGRAAGDSRLGREPRLTGGIEIDSEDVLRRPRASERVLHLDWLPSLSGLFEKAGVRSDP